MDDLFFSDPNGNTRPEETDLPAENNEVSMIDGVPSGPVVTFDETEQSEPLEPSLTFDHTEPFDPVEPSLTFEETEQSAPVEPSLTFEETEQSAPVEPSLTFEHTEQSAPVEPSLTFEHTEPFTPVEPSLTFEHSEKIPDDEPIRTEPAYEPPIGESADVRYDEPYSDEEYGDEPYGGEPYSGEPYGDEPYDEADYDDGDYDEYYDDEYYDEEYPSDAYAHDESEGTESFYYSGPASHSYDPNGNEDERPVYGSYYTQNTGETTGLGAAVTGETTGLGAAGTDRIAGLGAANVGTGETSPAEQADAAGDVPQAADDRGPYKSKYDAYRFVTPGGPFAEKSQAKKTGPQLEREPEKTERKEGEKGKKGKKGGLLGRLLSTAILAILFGFIASGVFLGVLKLTGFSAPKQEEHEIEQAVPSPLPSLDNQESRVTAGKADTADDITAQSTELTVPEVVEMCMPSMVAITNTTVQQYYDFFGGASSRENVSVGSGIIVGETDTELLIATNNHVISNSSEITVTFIDENVVAGTVKGTDADNDLAIVAVKLEDIGNETKDAIRLISIGDSDSLSVGETVIAIGNALGYGQSVSRGVISALNREVVVDGMVHQLIQTDASINPGNSGGALLNMRGELVGINEIKYVDKNVEGVGYAIPMATAKPILDSLGARSARTIVDDEHASYIGIMCIDVPSYYVQSGYPSGVYVSELTKGGPAEKAGIKEGDIITAMDGISITSTNQLITYLRYYAADEEIDFSVSRLNEEETAFEKVKIKITLGYRKDSGIDESKETEGEPQPDMGAENGGFDVIPDQKR